ncbi:hypothetical protein [uncultured Hymenobacter sp.]|uniref:hypothetical protein n=1 Tax=uncultured Hymenobacter sp. TaxID=170016 RepID=UPI0035C9A8DA
MKHAEKLDAILRELYDRGSDKKDQMLNQICEAKNIPLKSRDELYAIADRLEKDGYVVCQRISAGIYATLTSHGIEYCEEDSYAYKGHAIVTNQYNLSITNSPNANIVSASTSTNIQITSHGEIKNKISELKKRISTNNDITNNQKADILECIEEVENAVDSGRKPKFALKQLIEQASNVAGVGSLLLDLGQLIMGQ